MTAGVHRSAATRQGDLTELRLLIELPALRKLADRGLSYQELALIRKLAKPPCGRPAAAMFPATSRQT
jgi:hypothetical protein